MLKRYAEVMKTKAVAKEALSTTAYQYQRFVSIIFYLIGTRVSTKISLREGVILGREMLS